IGIWKMLGIIAILIPGFKLVKEWAYAGIFFTMTGAVISHIASNNVSAQIISPAVLALFTVLSWYLRPANRKIASVN
ncbi:MAG TPA: DoxX family protein, partial [Mucilaginibacter sp.]